MGTRVIEVSTLFQRAKTTVPQEIRGILEVRDGDKIVWLIDEDTGRIVVEAASKKGARYRKSI